MKFEIKHQESYSRGKLLLRSFFGIFYIALPHYFVMFFVGIWFMIQTMLLPLVILFTGNMPESWFEFRVKFIAWMQRVQASLSNLTDEYPAFGPSGTSESVIFEMERPEKLSRVLNFLNFLKVFAVIPHNFVLPFVMLWAQILGFFAWWSVLFTGKFPEKSHTTIVNSMRWSLRVMLYSSYLMTDQYPPFSGKSDEELGL